MAWTSRATDALPDFVFEFLQQPQKLELLGSRWVEGMGKHAADFGRAIWTEEQPVGVIVPGYCAG
jgi:hypothetical protein